MRNVTRRDAISFALRTGAALSVTTFPLSNRLRAQIAGQPITKPIPTSGEEIPVIGLGTGSSFSRAAREPAEHGRLASTLRRFTELGGALIDTAPNYGQAEPVLGDLLRRLDLRSEVFFATKVAGVTGREAGLQQARISAARAAPRVVDLHQVHNLVDWRTQIPLLFELKADGLARYVGATTYRDEQYRDLEAILMRYELDFIQVDYSIMNRSAEDRVLPAAADRGAAVIANMPFGNGRVFSALGDREAPAWITEFGATTWAQFILRWIVSHPTVTAAIPATSNPAHVQDNVRAAYQPLSSQPERQEMAARFQEWINE